MVNTSFHQQGERCQLLTVGRQPDMTEHYPDAAISFTTTRMASEIKKVLTDASKGELVTGIAFTRSDNSIIGTLLSLKC